VIERKRMTGRHRSLRTLGAVLATLLAAAPALAADKPKTDDEKTVYFLGVMVAEGLKRFELTPKEADLVKAGLGDAIKGKPMELDEEVYMGKIMELGNQRMARASSAFVEEAKKQKGAEVTESGLVYREVGAGQGESPDRESTVKVHYHGTLPYGTVFDSSLDRGEPVEFPVNRVIPCWTEALQKMKVGGKSHIVCPAAIAYGDRGMPPAIPGGSALAFDVELIEIVK